MKDKIYRSKSIEGKLEDVKLELLEFDRKMQEGYRCSLDNRNVEAAQLWREVFFEMKDLFSKLGIDGIVEFDEVVNVNQFVSNWVQDYDELLHNIIVTVSGEDKKRYGEEKLELLGFILESNDSEDPSYLNHLHSKADTYYLIGEQDKGEKIFEYMINVYSDYEWGYVGYSDHYWMRNSGIKDYTKAMRILHRGYKRDTLVEKDVIVKRLFALQDKIKKELDENKQQGFDGKGQIEKKYNELYDMLEEIREIENSKTARRSGINYSHQPIVKGPKIGRNDPCPCGSGKKFKKCCGK